MTLNPSKDMQPNFSGPKGTKQCQICAAWVSGFKQPPENHICMSEGKKIKDARACQTCWEAHISSEIERKRHDEVECMFCSAFLGRPEFKKLGVRKDTMHRYSQKQTDSTKFKCQARCKGIDTPLQAYNRETDGRIFTCKDCNFETCVDCDRPEHPKETCEEYQSRVHSSNPSHEFAEAQTLAAFASCPRCKTLVTVEKGCGYVQCALGNKMSKDGITGGCGHRFCSHCLINWVGDESAYLGGKMQHGFDKKGKRCKYATRVRPSDHGLKHRFVSDDEEDEEDVGGEDSDSEDEQPVAKKRKTEAK